MSAWKLLQVANAKEELLLGGNQTASKIVACKSIISTSQVL